MPNTHRALVETSVPPSVTLIASGDRGFCETMLASHIKKHPLTEYAYGLVLEVESTRLPDSKSLAVYNTASVVTTGVAHRLQPELVIVRRLITELVEVGDDGTYVEPLREIADAMTRMTIGLDQVGS